MQVAVACVIPIFNTALVAQQPGQWRPIGTTNPAITTTTVQKGTRFFPGAAIINGSGKIDGASGAASNCVHVDGSSGPCGTAQAGDQTGGVTLPIQITDVTGLTNELNIRTMRGTGFMPSRTAVINTSGMVDAAVGNLDDCVHVDGSSGPCGSGTTGVSGATFYDAETPGGTVDGSNTTFSLNASPNPPASLQLMRNGIVQRQGTDYFVSGSTVTFLAGAVPQSGDIVQAWYRGVGGSGNVPVFHDAETPSGVVDSSNATFTLSTAPNPASSLQIMRNGVVQRQGADYTLSGATVTIFSWSVPQAGDILQAWYRASQ